MREIKFRAWQITHKYMTFDISMVQSNDGVVSCFYYGDAEDGISMREDWDVMQYTGLKDKNGKEIYEGDIIEILTDTGRKEMFTVKWGIHRRSMASGYTVDIPSFSFVNTDGFPSFPIVDNYAGKHDLEIIEVIGNIYQNPQLINTSPSSKPEGDAAGE